MSEADNELSYPERELITVEAREELARDIRRLAGRHNDPDDSVYEVVAKMARKIEELEAQVEQQTMAVGWMYAEACRMADAGEDIRQAEFPALIAQCIEDLSKDTKGGEGE